MQAKHMNLNYHLDSRNMPIYSACGCLKQLRELVMHSQPQSFRRVEVSIDKQLDRITELQRLINEEEQALFLYQKQCSQNSKEQSEETFDLHLDRITEFQRLLNEEEEKLFLCQKQQSQILSEH